MNRLTQAGTGLALAMATIGAARMGGWAVVTVETVPEYFVVGKTTPITFAVRQHAVTLLDDVSPRLTATSGRREVAVTATRAGGGRYRADLVVPSKGDWRIEIASGFGKSSGHMLPVHAIDASTPAPAPLPDAERGRLLFAAKGCVTCHVHGAIDIKGDLSDLGPELTTRRFAAVYLSQFLADPSIKPAEPGKSQMPKPDLRQADIAPLVAFINAGRATAAR